MSSAKDKANELSRREVPRKEGEVPRLLLGSRAGAQSLSCAGPVPLRPAQMEIPGVLIVVGVLEVMSLT